MKRLAAAALAAMLALTAPSGATAAPSAKQLKLAEQLFSIMDMEKLMSQASSQMRPVMIEQMRRSNPKIRDKEAGVVADAVNEASVAMTQQLKARMIPIYAETFTEKELEDVLAFYSTPSGQAMLQKMPQLMSHMAPLMRELMPAMAADVQARVCSKIDCSKRTPPKT